MARLGSVGMSRSMSASLIGRLGSSTFRLSTTAVLMSLAGSRFSSELASGRLATVNERRRSQFNPTA